MCVCVRVYSVDKPFHSGGVISEIKYLRKIEFVILLECRVFVKNFLLMCIELHPQRIFPYRPFEARITQLTSYFDTLLDIVVMMISRLSTFERDVKLLCFPFYPFGKWQDVF